MKKQIDVSSYLYVLILVIIYFIGTSSLVSQEFINGDFNDRIAKDIVAVEFWADWNKTNQFNDLAKLKDCNVYRVDIMANADTQAKYDVSAIPTVIIFESGQEKARFNANIMFQLEADKKTVQHSVDTIMLNKFQ
tara:strand:- start:192 stop:596 length:405 start_codon:yes stop_codon:yes gene_type:complete